MIDQSNRAGVFCKLYFMFKFILQRVPLKNINPTVFGLSYTNRNSATTLHLFRLFEQKTPPRSRACDLIGTKFTTRGIHVAFICKKSGEARYVLLHEMLRKVLPVRRVESCEMCFKDNFFANYRLSCDGRL